MNQEAKAQLDALQTYGTQPGNAEFKAQEYFVRSTIAFEPGVPLTAKKLFIDSNAIDDMYRSDQFPSSSQAFNVTHIQVFTDMLFTATDPEDQRAKFAHYINFSELLIKKDGNEVYRIPLREIVDFSIVPTGGKYTTVTVGENTSTVYQATEMRMKFNNRYKLLNEILIPANQKLEFQIIPAKGLTAHTVGVYHPFLDLPNDKGFIFDITCTTTKLAGTKV